MVTQQLVPLRDLLDHPPDPSIGRHRQPARGAEPQQATHQPDERPLQQEEPEDLRPRRADRAENADLLRPLDHARHQRVGDARSPATNRAIIANRFSPAAISVTSRLALANHLAPEIVRKPIASIAATVPGRSPPGRTRTSAELNRASLAHGNRREELVARGRRQEHVAADQLPRLQRRPLLPLGSR